MKLLRRWMLAVVVSAQLVVCFPLQGVSALGVDRVLIAQVAANVSTASQEFVSLYNNSDVDLDVTGWCLWYNTSMTKPGCITQPDSQTKLLLAARSYVAFASTDFVAAYPDFVPQARTPFAPGMSDTAGSLMLVDQKGEIRDRFAWSKKLAAGTVYQRTNDMPGHFRDTDVDSVDFAAVSLALPANQGLYEYAEPADICPNFEGVQVSMPTGYEHDDQGSCLLDVCSNISGLQESIPQGYELTAQGECMQTPKESAVIEITELLPNPLSYDSGNEFVELYNPHDRPINLSAYVIQLGPAFVRSKVLPSMDISPGGYLVLSDKELGFSLPNGEASLRLVAADGTIVSEVLPYGDAPEGYSWSMVSSQWMFTSQVTAGATNISDLSKDTNVATPEEIPAGIVACPPGKYRNPSTNRCRNIATPSPSKPCGPGQYRNPATNRCRNLGVLAGSWLTPCQAGQQRNPITNRCRNTLASVSSPKPCEEGYERNHETNRCRKIPPKLAAQSTDEGAAAQPRSNYVLMIIMVTLTVGYGVYEYRYDMANVYLRSKQWAELRRAGKAGEKSV